MSAAGADLGLGTAQGAMQFFWQGKHSAEAFAVAEQHGLLEQYLRLTGANASPEDMTRAVAALEARGDYDRAAELHRTMGNLPAAAAMYIKVMAGLYCALVIASSHRGVTECGHGATCISSSNPRGCNEMRHSAEL